MNYVELGLKNLSRIHGSPKLLNHFESKQHSQNGEDGMIAEALDRLGILSPRFVEIGAGDGSENCTIALLLAGGEGVWLEIDSANVSRAAASTVGLPIEILNVRVSRDNIVEVLENSRAHHGFDLLVVDIDGNDFHVIERILQKWKPSLIVCEYNSAFGPRKKWVMQYNDLHSWSSDDNYGASLSAYQTLFKRFGYALAACDSSGVNALWVSRENINLFRGPMRASEMYMSLVPGRQHRRQGDHVVDHPLSIDDFDKIHLVDWKTKRFEDLGIQLVTVRVRNGSSFRINSFGNYPIHIGALESAGAEPTRLFFAESIAPGQCGVASAVIPIGQELFRFAVVQESVRWGSPVRLRRLKASKRWSLIRSIR